MKPTDIPDKERKFKFLPFLKPVFKWGARLIFALIFLFLFAFLLLKIPAVQKKAISITEGFLSDELKTEVAVKHISIEFFDRLALDSFLVKDLKGDTLLFVDKLTANLNSGPLAWINRTIILEDVELNGADLQIRRPPEELKSNLTEYINVLRPKQKKKRKPFFLDMETLYLKNINVSNIDTRKGELHHYKLKSGIIEVEKIDIVGNDFIMDDIEFNEIYASIQKTERDTNLLKINKLPIDTTEPDSNTLFVSIESLEITDGVFVFDNNRYPEREWLENVFDNRHVMINDLNMVHENITYQNEVVKSKIKSGSLKENSGFEIEKFDAAEFEFSDTKMAFYDMDMKTPYSEIGDTLIFKFRELSDFNDVNNKVYITAILDETIVGFQDLLTFFKSLNSNAFFTKNQKEFLRISGELKGKINSLKGYDLAVDLGKGLKFYGDFRSRDLAIKDEEYLDLEVKRLRTTMNTMIDLVPSFNPPENFKKLGNLNFDGNFLGFLNDFVAFGDLRTDLGRATMDMNLNVRSGRETATYSGNMSLDHFDLGAWTDNPDFGEVTFTSRVKEGIGLTGPSAAARLEATIDTFFFKNYRYENIAVNGNLERELFSGDLEIHDNNIDLTFAGDIDFQNKVPRFDFKSNINILNLQKLNISKEKMLFSGEIDMNILNQEYSKMEGEIDIRSFAMNKGGDHYRADSIILKNNFVGSGKKIFEVDADFMKATLEGKFDLEQLPTVFLNYYADNFPKFIEKFGLKNKKLASDSTELKFDIAVSNFENFTSLIHPKLDSLDEFTISGKLNTIQDSLKFTAKIPKTLQFAGVRMRQTTLYNRLEGSEGDISFSTDKSQFRNFEIPALIITCNPQSDTIPFGLFVTEIGNHQIVEDLNLDGKLFISDDEYQINLDPSSLMIAKQKWDLPNNNFIRFSKNELYTKNFKIENESKSVVLNSINQNRGLAFDFQNFDLDFIEELWSYKPLDFSGNFSLSGEVQDIFNLKGFKVNAMAESLKVNEDDFGKMDLSAGLSDLQSVLFAKINVKKGEQKLIVDGKYLLPSASKALKNKGLTNVGEKNYFDLDIDVIKYPISMLEYWVTSGISETGGTISSTDLRVFGYPGKPEISGTAFSENGQTKINYLNTLYFIEKGQLVLNNKMIDATGSILRDARGNFADVYGGLTHVWLKKLGLDATIRSDKFEALNTKKSKDAVFYGYAMGSGLVNFSGDFKQTDIDVIATTGPETSISIPISYENSASESSFIEFVDKKQNQISSTAPNSGTVDLRGINLDMQLTVTEDADMKMIFDEKAGDIINGKGKGAINIKVLRDGTFSMNGDYVIGSGNYLFTLGSIVNKQFEVARGGTIRWFGDPFGADINIVANYADLKAPVSNLILEYFGLMSDELKREASQATKINLTMMLQGQLLKPDISFAIDFPELSGELKTYVQSKLRVLERNQNELNRQVFGLMITGQFLPGEFQFDAGGIASSTFSEFIANQITLYIKDLLTDLITNNEYFSDIDFDFAYNTFQNINLTAAGASFGTTSSTVQVNLKPFFLENRLSLDAGAQWSLDDDPTNPQVRAGDLNALDFTVEYALSKDKKLRLKVYGGYEKTITDEKQRYGIGLRYRKEFDKLNPGLYYKRKKAEK